MAAILRRAQPFLHQTRENVRNLSRENQLMSKACFSSTGRQSFSADGKNSDRVFANYNIYKGKASLSVSPRLPEFSKIDSGGLVVNRQGSVMLSFSPAIGERKYDWEKKQLFALSSTEVGSLISLGPQESCEFFHDPSMKSSNAGQVAKTLQVKPYGDGSEYFFSLSVKNKILNTTDRLTVPVSKAEFAVMRTAFSFVLPHIMGWDRFTNQPPKVIEDNAGSIVDPQHQGLEWDR